MKASGSWGYVSSMGSDYLKQQHLVAVFNVCYIPHEKSNKLWRGCCDGAVGGYMHNKFAE